ncbi:MAG: efflux RND transporter permease subunit [Acidobacteria bacterium]|nr:efflux RND transporter permease subunit [Acidobacteriota bacterium]
MWLVIGALRRPITVIAAVIALVLTAWLAVERMRKDIFPEVGAPTIYVSQPYGGMDAAQMEGFLTYYYEYHILYVTGIEHVESKNIQGAALIKLVFHPGTNMEQAMSEVVGYVNRSRSFMPPGAVPPFITRFDAGSVPVGQLVFSSPTRPPAEMQDFALNRVRPLFATLPGVSAPPPFGGNQRTIVVRANPDKLRQYNMSPDEVIGAVNRASTVIPSGNVRIGDLNRIANTNAVIGGNFQELMDAPIRPGVYVRDVAAVENGTDVITGYAHSNGKRTVYMNVTKRSDASTLDVIAAVRANLPKMKAAVPDDVDVRLEFDQSGYVRNALRSLVNEGLLGALLTGLMVLIFLRHWRSALIVVLTIPFSLLGAVVGLWFVGQTINMMTLAGLALGVGVLVDEATVEVENIHAHRATGLNAARAVREACSKTALARFMSMLAVLAVFVPSFFLAGVARQLFVPLSLAVGFAMVSSYILSSTLVPVLSVWLMKAGAAAHETEAPGGGWYRRYAEAVVKARWVVAPLYLAGAALVVWLFLPSLGRELFPPADANQYQIRLRAKAGTRIERTELVTLKALDVVKAETGVDKIAISTAFIGVQPPSYPINLVHLFTSGPHEAVLRFALKDSVMLRGDAMKEKLRAALTCALPDVRIAFEEADIVGQVLSFGSPSKIEVAVQAPQIALARDHAIKVHRELTEIRELRDLQQVQALDYPSLDIKIDRDRAGQFGLTTSNVARSVMAATSSSRFVDANYWRDPVSGNGFQIQVEIPQHRTQSIDDLRELPVMNSGAARPLLGDVAEIKTGTTFGQVERYNMQRVVSYTADVVGVPLGAIAPRIRAAVAKAGEPPRGVTVALRGQIPLLEETLAGLERGLLLSIAVVFLLLAANFQSFRLALAALLAVPGALAGVVLALWFTGTTLNVQSYLGAIMAVGIAVANSILMVTFMDLARHGGATVEDAAAEGARGRLRAVVMTAAAMIAGMIPLALALGEGASQSAPLGKAVIGGLLFATIATLTVLPAAYALLQPRQAALSPSLDPDDPASRDYETA